LALYVAQNGGEESRHEELEFDGAGPWSSSSAASSRSQAMKFCPMPWILPLATDDPAA
jgi:hypothetical protein